MRNGTLGDWGYGDATSEMREQQRRSGRRQVAGSLDGCRPERRQGTERDPHEHAIGPRHRASEARRRVGARGDRTAKVTGVRAAMALLCATAALIAAGQHLRPTDSVHRARPGVLGGGIGEPAVGQPDADRRNAGGSLLTGIWIVSDNGELRGTTTRSERRDHRGEAANRAGDGIFIGLGLASDTLAERERRPRTTTTTGSRSAEHRARACATTWPRTTATSASVAVAGVTDLGGNSVFRNGNPLQCVNVFCED